ncbi:MAG: DNA methyltransferase [Bacteroidota bacterium]
MRVFENFDNMELMARYPDKYFDLAIVDPPYGINAPDMQMGSNPNRSRTDGYGSGPGVSTAVKQKNRLQRLNGGGGKLKDRILNRTSISWDYAIPSPEYFAELKRVSKNQIIWGGNYFPLPPTRCVVCWDKMQPWENFSQFELAWTSFDKPAALFRYSNTGGTNNEKKIHPTQKPIALYKWLLQRFAQPGDLLLDTHVGSASSLVAFEEMGFDYAACEIDPSNYSDASKRLQLHRSSPRFDFLTPQPPSIQLTI